MSFNGHTKILNNGMPSALSVKKGGSVVESVKDSIGDISTSVMDTTSNISNTLQGQFSRFMNNPLFTSENKEDNIMIPTTTGNNVLNTNIDPSIPTLNGGGKKKKQKNTRKRKVKKNGENKDIKKRKRKAKKTIKRRRKSSHKNKRLISK